MTEFIHRGSKLCVLIDAEM